MADTKSLDYVSLKKKKKEVLVLFGVVLIEGVKSEKAGINTHSMRMKWQQNQIEIIALTYRN